MELRPNEICVCKGYQPVIMMPVQQPAMQTVYQYVPSGGQAYGQARMMKGSGGIHNKMRQTKQNVAMRPTPIE